MARGKMNLDRIYRINRMGASFARGSIEVGGRVGKL